MAVINIKSFVEKNMKYNFLKNKKKKKESLLTGPLQRNRGKQSSGKD